VPANPGDSKNREHVRELARSRMRSLRKRDRKERLPSTREVDHCLRDGLVGYVTKHDIKTSTEAWAHNTIGEIVAAAYRHLRRSNFDTANPKTLARFWRRLGLPE